jgi:HD-GYP domain-containing protein (c-di-GMP phosphodiesterase class II)
VRLVTVADCPDGATIARDVRASVQDAIPLLGVGATLRPTYRPALERSGITHLFIDDELSAGIDPVGVVPPEIRTNAIRAVSDLIGTAYEAMTRRTRIDRAHVQALEPVAKQLALEVQRREPSLPTLGASSPPGEYLAAHSVDVAVLGMLIAVRYQREHGWVDTATGSRRYDTNDQGIGRLGHALLLVDLGKAAVPRGVLEHPGPLEESDRETVCAHAELGAGMLPSGASFLTKNVMRHHHERWDGSGYPDGLAGDEISWESRIAAIADVFDATISNRVYCGAAPQHEAWNAIVAGAGTLFDPVLVETFRSIVVPYPPATDVVLADGRTAVVARVEESDPLRPTVRAFAPDGTVEELESVPVQPPARAERADRAA